MSTPSKAELELRAALADTSLVAFNVRALETRHLDFAYLHRAMPRAAGPDRLAAFESMPLADQEEAWRALGQRRRDQHWLDGHVSFERDSARRTRQAKRPKRRRKIAKLDLEPTLEQIRQIPAEQYLEDLAGVEPRRGVVTCPAPDHHDRNPSASYTGTLWHCHACQAGGDLIELASLISGIPARGRTFYELVIWIAERVHVQIDRERIEAALK